MTVTSRAFKYMFRDLVYTLVQDLGHLGTILEGTAKSSMKNGSWGLTPFSPLADAPKCGCFHLAWKPFFPFFTSSDICHQNGMSLIYFLALRCIAHYPQRPIFVQKLDFDRNSFASVMYNPP